MSAALADDLNTPLALAALHDVLAEINKAEGDAKHALRSELLASGAAMGLLQQEPEAWLKGAPGDDDGGEIDALIDRRNAARKSRDFAEADRIRTELAIRGVVLEDGPGGTTWRRAG